MRGGAKMGIRITKGNPHSVRIAPYLCSDCEWAISALNLSLVVIYLLMQNVTGQGTRHLVEGTLDPLVGGLPF